MYPVDNKNMLKTNKSHLWDSEPIANSATSGSEKAKKAVLTCSGCFVAGTLIHTDKGLVPIQDIKVGDRVLSKPEDGSGEPEYKPVVTTFVHEDKEIWLVSLDKDNEIFDKNDEMLDYEIYKSASACCDFLATANHPVWVVGYRENPIEDITFYDEPHWKRVDELRQYDIAVNPDGVMYAVERAQPIYQVAHERLESNPNYYWYQEHYYEDYYDDYVQDGPDYMVDSEAEYKGKGYVEDISEYQENGWLSDYIDDDTQNIHRYNQLTDQYGNRIPYTATVYNFEVADNHTYFIDDVGVWVHNTSSPAQKRLQTAREIANGVTANSSPSC